MEERILEGRNRCPNHAKAFFVGARDELPITVDQAFGAHVFAGWNERSRKEDVINAEQENDVLNARLRQHVTVKSCQTSFAQKWPESLRHRSKWPARLARAIAVTQHAIADDAFIQHKIGRAHV